MGEQKEIKNIFKIFLAVWSRAIDDWDENIATPFRVDWVLTASQENDPKGLGSFMQNNFGPYHGINDIDFCSAMGISFLLSVGIKMHEIFQEADQARKINFYCARYLNEKIAAIKLALPANSQENNTLEIERKLSQELKDFIAVIGLENIDCINFNYDSNGNIHPDNPFGLVFNEEKCLQKQLSMGGQAWQKTQDKIEFLYNSASDYSMAYWILWSIGSILHLGTGFPWYIMFPLSATPWVLNTMAFSYEKINSARNQYRLNPGKLADLLKQFKAKRDIANQAFVENSENIIQTRDYQDDQINNALPVSSKPVLKSASALSIQAIEQRVLLEQYYAQWHKAFKAKFPDSNDPQQNVQAQNLDSSASNIHVNELERKFKVAGFDRAKQLFFAFFLGAIPFFMSSSFVTWPYQDAAALTISTVASGVGAVSLGLVLIVLSLGIGAIFGVRAVLRKNKELNKSNHLIDLVKGNEAEHQQSLASLQAQKEIKISADKIEKAKLEKYLSKKTRGYKKYKTYFQAVEELEKNREQKNYLKKEIKDFQAFKISPRTIGGKISHWLSPAWREIRYGFQHLYAVLAVPFRLMRPYLPLKREKVYIELGLVFLSLAEKKKAEQEKAQAEDEALRALHQELTEETTADELFDQKMLDYSALEKNICDPEQNLNKYDIHHTPDFFTEISYWWCIKRKRQALAAADSRIAVNTAKKAALADKQEDYKNLNNALAKYKKEKNTLSDLIKAYVPLREEIIKAIDQQIELIQKLNIQKGSQDYDRDRDREAINVLKARKRQYQSTAGIYAQEKYMRQIDEKIRLLNLQQQNHPDLDNPVKVKINAEIEYLNNLKNQANESFYAQEIISLSALARNKFPKQPEDEYLNRAASIPKTLIGRAGTGVFMDRIVFAPNGIIHSVMILSGLSISIFAFVWGFPLFAASALLVASAVTALYFYKKYADKKQQNKAVCLDDPKLRLYCTQQHTQCLIKINQQYVKRSHQASAELTELKHKHMHLSAQLSLELSLQESGEKSMGEKFSVFLSSLSIFNFAPKNVYKKIEDECELNNLNGLSDLNDENLHKKSALV